MTTLESLILSWLANALWQLPLLFAAGWLAARLLRTLGPAVEHRLWVGVLLLQALLPAISIIPWESLRSLLHGILDLSAAPPTNGQPHVSVVMGPGEAFGNPHLPAWLLACIAVAYAALTLFLAARFLWRLYRIGLLRRGAAPIPLAGPAADHWNRCEQRFRVPNAVLAASPEVFGPITIGIARRLVLLPPAMLRDLPGPELGAAIAHEFAHMRRHDFLKNLLYEFVCLPVRFHPMLSITRNRLTETREMICDQLAAGLGEPHQYARSLLGLATLLVDGTLTSTPHTIGILDSTSFERRVMQLTKTPARPSALGRVATIAASVLFGAAICAATVALSVHIDALAAGDQHRPSQPNGPIHVKADVMQNQILHKVPPVYPLEAKKARIQGDVELEAIIGKTGEVENLRVISGPAALQRSALDAVRQWTYKPFLLNGAPVVVKSTINVTYTLGKWPVKK
jgi:TonB family protein